MKPRSSKQHGFTMIEVIAVLAVIVIATALFATFSARANQQQRVTTLVNQILQVRQAIENQFKSAPNFANLSYNLLLQENVIPPEWQSATSNTQGITPFGIIGVSRDPYPGNPANSADFARITVVVNDAHACADLVRALAPGSARFYESQGNTSIVPVAPSDGSVRDMSGVSAAQATCSSAISSYGTAVLVYDFI